MGDSKYIKNLRTFVAYLYVLGVSVFLSTKFPIIKMLGYIGDNGEPFLIPFTCVTKLNDLLSNDYKICT
jgi:hypothetical protein